MPTRRSSSWGITTRLVMIASAPAVLMFLVITVALYFSGQDEAVEAVRERGALIASSLAQTGQYGLVSGNSASLQRSIKRMVDSDPSIAAIQVRDANGLVVAAANAPDRRGSLTFEKEMRADVFALDLLDNSRAAIEWSVPGAASREERVVGRVTVSMSSAPIVAVRLRRVLYSVGAVLAAAFISVLAGLALAQRLREPLHAVMAALRGIRQGRFEVALPADALGELGELQATINEMAQWLSMRREQLHAQVEARTAELKAAMEQARTADAERRRLLARSNRQLEDERKRISVEIHDHLNASIIALRSKAQHIAEVAAGMDGELAHDVHVTATEMTLTMDKLYKSARGLIKQLRPEVIDVLGLTGALQEMTREYNQLVPAIRFVLYVPPDFPNMRGQVAIVAYRLVQEALSNVVKHSSASRVEVSLTTSTGSAEVLIAVHDDGAGFDPAKVPGDSLGLAGMRERVSGAGGRMRIRSRVGRGTRVTFRLPLVDCDETSG